MSLHTVHIWEAVSYTRTDKLNLKHMYAEAAYKKGKEKRRRGGEEEEGRRGEDGGTSSAPYTLLLGAVVCPSLP